MMKLLNLPQCGFQRVGFARYRFISYRSNRSAPNQKWPVDEAVHLWLLMASHSWETFGGRKDSQPGSNPQGSAQLSWVPQKGFVPVLAQAL